MFVLLVEGVIFFMLIANKYDSKPFLNNKGNVNGVIATFKKTTQPPEIVEELDLFFNFALDAFLIIDFDGNIRQVNSVFSEQLGYDRGKILKNPVTSHILNRVHPDDIMLALASFKKVITGNTLELCEFRLRGNHGKYKWYSWTARPLLEKGLIYASARDITDKKKIEEELKNSHNEINNILESISDSFFALDNRWRFTYINKGADKHLSKRREELIGRDCRDFFHSAEMIKCFDRTMTQKESAHYEVYLQRFRKWLEVHQYPANKGICVYFRDITENKNLEREMERLDRLNLIGQMAAGIGHEIRNPMTTVRGFLQMLSSKDENMKNKQYFSLMIDELDRANSIITDYLSLAKDKTIDSSEQNLNLIIKSIFPLLQADAMLNNKNVLLDVGKIPNILADEKEIRQLLLNLARNGLEAMDSGGELTIRTFTDANEVVLAVSDLGTGIDPKIMDKIGTPFFTTKSEGTGLGMAVCYSIASRHKATIDIDSSDRGTTFYVKFPIQEEKNK